MWTKLLLVAVSIPVLGGAYWLATNLFFLETADYEVVLEDGAYEIRDYPELAVARTGTSVQGDDSAFGKLFRFIQGGNSQKQKIAMTTPVFMDDSEMSFVLPRAVKTGGIPDPTIESVTIGYRPSLRVAVYRFSGVADRELRDEALDKLTAWMAQWELEPCGEVMYAYYNAPFIPGPLRRNEVMFQVLPVGS